MMRKIKFVLILPLLLTFTTYGGSGLTLDEKIELLFEAKSLENRNELKVQLEAFISELHTYDNVSPKKRIKKIFSATKDRYLGNYYINSFFPDLLSNKNYNCVTGSALLALIFDELDIPYSIIELPQHVYLVAYPETHQISVESTSEKNKGLYYWSDFNKNETVEFLYNIEEVSEFEIKLKGIDAILEEYYYANEARNFETLIGMHFFNRALVLNDRKSPEQALHFIQRARDYYDNNLSRSVEGAILTNLIGDTELEDINLIRYLSKYYSLLTQKAHKQRIESHFYYAIQEALMSRHDQAYVDSTIVILDETITDSLDHKTLLSRVYEIQAIWHYNRRQYVNSFENAEKGYYLNPGNKEFEDLIGAVIPEVLLKDEPDEEELFELMKSREEEFPFLAESPKYINFSVMTYAILAGEAFLYNEPDRGLSFLKKIEPSLKHPDLEKNLIDPLMGEAYGEAASYYYREKEFKIAKEWIEKALLYDPNSESLLSKEKYIVEKLK